jgi:hypothetical protein
MRLEATTMEPQRLTTWIEWYRFARATLELPHVEASHYATARFLEEQNRELIRTRRAA